MHQCERNELTEILGLWRYQYQLYDITHSIGRRTRIRGKGGGSELVWGEEMIYVDLIEVSIGIINPETYKVPCWDRVTPGLSWSVVNKEGAVARKNLSESRWARRSCSIWLRGLVRWVRPWAVVEPREESSKDSSDSGGEELWMIGRLIAGLIWVGVASIPATSACKPPGTGLSQGPPLELPGLAVYSLRSKVAPLGAVETWSKESLWWAEGEGENWLREEGGGEGKLRSE